METSPSVISASNEGELEDNNVLVKYMKDYDEYSPFTVVLNHLQFSTLDDYATSARARLESSRLHSPPLLFLFRVMNTAPLYEHREAAQKIVKMDMRVENKADHTQRNFQHNNLYSL